MFPLQSVVLPGSLIPLHIFEDRYRALARDCVAGDGIFGTVLILRGSEVGGGDHRSTTGTLLQVREAEEFDDGRWGIMADATERIDVREWLDDDPYPRALVASRPEDPAGEGLPLLSEVQQLIDRFWRLATARAEAQLPTPPLSASLPDDPSEAVWQMAAWSGAGPLDLLRLLETDALVARMQCLEGILSDQLALLGPTD